MVEYKRLKDESIKLTDSQISSLVDKHFQGMQDLLARGAISTTDKVKNLLASSETSGALKYLFKRELKRASGMDVNYGPIDSKELRQLEKFGNIVASLSEKERKTLNNIFKIYGENIKGQNFESISVFEKIKLFFQRILMKLKSNGSKGNIGLFYWDPENEVEETHQPGREVVYSEKVLEEDENQSIDFSDIIVGEFQENGYEKISRSPILETIVEEDEDIYADNVAEIISQIKNNKELVPQEISIPATQFAQEEILPKPQVTQIEKKSAKPAVPPKPQKVIDAGNRIREKYNQKTEIYTSSAAISSKPAGEKLQIAPKPTIKICSQAEKQYGQNVADKKQFFESLNTNPKTKVKGKVERLVEKFEAKNQGVA